MKEQAYQSPQPTDPLLDFQLYIDSHPTDVATVIKYTKHKYENLYDIDCKVYNQKQETKEIVLFVQNLGQLMN